MCYLLYYYNVESFKQWFIAAYKTSYRCNGPFTGTAAHKNIGCRLQKMLSKPCLKMTEVK